MAYDVAYHVFDRKLLTHQIVPFLMGEIPSIQPIITRLSEVRINRFIANQYAGKIVATLTELAQDDSIDGRASLKKLAEDFDPFWYIWGRPFFVTETDDKKIVEIIDQYLQANPGSVEAIIKNQMNNIHPLLSKHIKVSDEDLAECPSLDELKQTLTNDANLIKKVVYAALHQQPFISDDGKEYDPKRQLNNPFILLELLALGLPAWMDRGLINPSELIINSGLEMPAFARSASCLLHPLDEMLMLDDSQILFPCNYSLGMVVLPENVEEFRDYFQQNNSHFYSYLIGQQCEPYDANLILKKINEAIMYACQKKFLFVESTEIFSGIMGVAA